MKKNINKIVFAVVTVLLLAAMLSVCLCACDPNNDKGPAVVDPGEGDDTPETHEHTYSEFIAASNKANVVAFIDKVAQTTLASESEIVLKQYYINGHDYVVSSVNLIYICNSKNTEGKRSIKHFKYTFSGGIYVDDILAGKTSTLSFDGSLLTLFQYDVQENAEKQTLLTALYQAADLEERELKFFREEESAAEGQRKFVLFSQNENNAISRVTLIVECDASASDEALLAALADESKVTVTTSAPSVIRDGDTLVETINNLD